MEGKKRRSAASFSGKVSAPVFGNPEGLADLGSGLPLQPLALDLRCCRSRLPGVQGGWAPVLNEDRSEHRYFTDFSADCPPPPKAPVPQICALNTGHRGSPFSVALVPVDFSLAFSAPPSPIPSSSENWGQVPVGVDSLFLF